MAFFASSAASAVPGLAGSGGGGGGRFTGTFGNAGGTFGSFFGKAVPKPPLRDALGSSPHPCVAANPLVPGIGGVNGNCFGSAGGVRSRWVRGTSVPAVLVPAVLPSSPSFLLA